MAKSFTYKKVNYEIIDGNSVRVSNNKKYVGSLVIPETIEKNGTIYRVAEIDGYCPWEGLTSVEFPGSIKKVMIRAPHLESIVLNDGIEEICSLAFCKCHIKSINIPKSIKRIGYRAFWDCKSLEEVIITNPFGFEVTCHAFEGTPWLSNKLEQSDFLIIGNTLVGVNSKTRQSKRIELPKSCKHISAYAFAHCTALTEIVLPEGIKTIGEYAFLGCKSLTELNIPKSITELQESAFSGCLSLSAVKLPESLTRIGKRAFRNCRSLTELKIPDNVTELTDETFEGCISLKTVILPNNLTKIGKEAFAKCFRLMSLVLPSSVKVIESNAFLECYDLANIELPDCLEVLGDGAFGLCINLSTIRIPTSVQVLGENAFWCCYSLREALFSDGSAIKKDNVFSNCPNIGKKILKKSHSLITLEILADPYECDCFINLSKEDVLPFMTYEFASPEDDGFEPISVSFVGGHYREAYVNGKPVSINALFFRPEQFYFTGFMDYYDELCEILSNLKQGCYGIIDRRLIYKSARVFHIDLNGIPFNKLYLQRLEMNHGNLYSEPVREVQSKIIPSFSFSDNRLLYCGKEIYGEASEDLGSQGQVKRLVFYKDYDAIIKIVGEYTY